MSDHLSSSELLSAFLDGELEGAEATRLFYLLAQDADLQTEMRQHLAMRNALRVPLTLPPTGLREKISDAAGLLPAGTGDSVAPSDGATTGRKWRGGITPILLAAFLSSALTGLVITAFRGGAPQVARTAVPVASPGHDAAGAPGAAVRHAEAVGGAAPTDLVYGSSALLPGSPSSRSSYRVGTESSVRFDAHPGSGGRGHAGRSGEESRVLPSTPQRLAPAFDSNATGERVEAVRPVTVPTTPKSAEPEETPIVAEVRGFAATSYPRFDLASPSSSPFRSIAVGGYYELGEHDAVGVEVGRENVFQGYTRTIGGTTARYEQNYLATWVAGVYQYSLAELRQLEVQPFARVGLGAVATGPMGRGTVGVRYSIGPYSMMVGAEGSYFLYRYDGEWLSTKKLGITAGASIHF